VSPALDLDYQRSIFINCPFDPEYVPILRSVLFALIRVGLRPRIATERLVSNEHRLDKLMEMIPKCRFSIHDLSRLLPLEGKLARMNMPFELGIDWAWNHYCPELP